MHAVRGRVPEWNPPALLALCNDGEVHVRAATYGKPRLAYQEHIIQQTAIWRPHNSSSPGQDMCTMFFQFFQQARANDTDFGDRILVRKCDQSRVKCNLCMHTRRPLLPEFQCMLI